MTAYKDSGVDITAGYKLVEQIGDAVVGTHDDNVMPNFGSFAAMYELPKGYRNPVLVSCTDGVGTKVKLAEQYGFLDTIGQDLVAMCVNDMVCCGATPMVFLDYYATSSLDVAHASTVIKGIADACSISQCSLVGGETAEMPGVYSGTDFDLAGFATGIVDKHKIVDGSGLMPKDVLIGLRSSGFHSNGYSLLRKLIEADPSTMEPNFTTSVAIKEPTRIYVDAVLDTIKKGYDIVAMSHITGGGIVENLPRMFKQAKREVKARVDVKSIIQQMPNAFKTIQQKAKMSDQDMLNTFNCGVGMIWAVPILQATEIIQHLHSIGYPAWVIGEVQDK